MKTVTTASEYFDCVVCYNMEQYRSQPTSLPAAFNLANSLFNMHEWIWHTHRQSMSANLRDVREFNNQTQTLCPAFKYMRDLANASKHVSLTTPSTKASHISNTAVTGYGEGGYGVGGYGGGIVINDGGTCVNFLEEATKVNDYWATLLKSLT